jgi:hypothetical protein
MKAAHIHTLAAARFAARSIHGFAARQKRSHALGGGGGGGIAVECSMGWCSVVYVFYICR